MTGKIKNVINQIIEVRSKGNAVIVSTTKARLALKGVDPDKYTETSLDDPKILEKLKTIINEMKLQISI